MLAFLGNAFFALAFFLGIMYVIQDKYLKSRKLKGLYFILPSLDTLDELNYKCLQYGFPLLTAAIITGAIWSEYATGNYWQWKHRQVWSLITWFLYAALLHGRLTAGWRGKEGRDTLRGRLHNPHKLIHHNQFAPGRRPRAF